MRDYAELVKALRTCKLSIPCTECPFYSNGDEPSKECATMNVAAADAIEELLAAVPQWNPVSKPPKEKGDYWCNVRSYNFDDTYYQLEVWFDGEFFVIDGVCTDRVTHWMPIPEAPKEVEGDA